jgi:putative PIN family toxin of toxin-antitoxin system
MRVVIDTNVLVSAAIRDRNPEAVILFVIEHPEFEWIASPEIIEEYIEVLHRTRFNLPEGILQRWEKIFRDLITVVETRIKVDFPRDPKDAKFLTCALVTQADYFITGDKDFEEIYKIGVTTVIPVSKFKRLVCDVW